MTRRSVKKGAPLEKVYVRDKRSPTPSSEGASKIMSRIRSKDTLPEMLFRQLLWKNGVRGYRLHPKNIPGRPDICFTSRKIAIFIHGCFWHRCPHCNYPLPKSNQKFWQEKFEKNVQRDRDKAAELKKMKWMVMTIWECQLKDDRINRTMKAILKKLSPTKNI